jgi:HlyD family secretion protein
MYVVAEIYETDIHGIKIGQIASITSKGLAGELTGKVAEIGLQIAKKDVLGTDPAADVDARVVEVKIQLDTAASAKVQGLTNLQVNVVINL